jgi:exonuclease SbcC
VVTADEERAAADVTAETERARRAAEDRVALLRLEVTAARTVAGGDVEAATLAEAAASARDAHGRAQARAETLGTAEGALDQFRRERERQVQAQVSVDAQISSTAAKVADLRDRAALLLAEIATARGTDPTVAARVSRLERAATDLEALAVTLSDADRLRRGLADLVARVDNELLRLELPSVAAVRAAARTGEQITELEARCARHESELRAVLDQLADPAVREAAEAAEPDLVALAAQAQTAQERHLEAATRAESAAAKVLALQRLHGCALDWLTRRDPLAAAHSLADRLARLAEGKSTDNHLRMSLSAYVLAARLEQVAACASERLLRMSSGRYSLVHSADPTGGRSGNARSRGGLTLRVLDAWTGQERDPVTLSGGETFFVSLALALGLAEVVSSEAGGAVLETLFVDEGFGSLDDDTLDEVMGVLDDLRDGGRMVGIVSHVADLRQRIPTQLRVTKGRCGSTIAGGDPSAGLPVTK